MSLFLAPAPAPLTTADDRRPAPELPGGLLDAIAEALVRTPGSCSQSMMVLALVQEIHEVAAWLLDDPGSVELASLRRVLEEARAHHNRMNGSRSALESVVTTPTTASAGSAAAYDRVASAGNTSA